MKYIVQRNLDHNLKSFKSGNEIWLEEKDAVRLERAGAIKRSEETPDISLIKVAPVTPEFTSSEPVDSSVDTVDKVSGASAPETTNSFAPFYSPIPDFVGIPVKECPFCSGVSFPTKLIKIAKNGNRDFTFTCTACFKSSRFWIKQGDKIE